MDNGIYLGKVDEILSFFWARQIVWISIIHKDQISQVNSTNRKSTKKVKNRAYMKGIQGN